MGRVRRTLEMLLDARGADEELTRLRSLVRVQEREIARLRGQLDERQRGGHPETGTPYFRNASEPVGADQGLLVDEDECIGCGTCEAVCPQAFVMGDRVARVVEGGAEAACVADAIAACPVACIRQS